LPQRLQCIKALWDIVDEPSARDFILGLLSHLLGDRSQNVRWGALHLANRLSSESHDGLWPLIVQWGSATNKDTRMGVACFLLEHFLESDFRQYFAMTQVEIEKGNKRLAFTLAYCMKFGQAKRSRNARQFDQYVERLAQADNDIRELLVDRKKKSS